MTSLTKYEQVADLHAEAIGQGFLSSLGTSFLVLLYRAIDESPKAFLIVEEEDGQVVGFVSGGLGMGPIYRRLLAHPVQLALAILPSLLRPSTWVGIAEIVLRGKGRAETDTLPDAELMSLAVREEWRKRGIAGILYNRLRQSFSAAGVSEFKILVGEDLKAAHDFYRRMGAIALQRTELHRGQSSLIYVHKFCDT